MSGFEKDEFLPLFMRHQKQIYSFILMLLPNYADADDVMQETAQALWCKFDEFQPGTNFAAWACTTARNKIMNYRTKINKSKYIFSDPALMNIIGEAKEAIGDYDHKLQALQICLLKLSQSDRQLVALRYEQGYKVKLLAEKMGRSVNGLSHTLARVHQLLLKCIRHYIIESEKAAY